ncbi:MAG: UDP-N-acetylglucosamine 2-epimerase (non-hydrolyzing) [Candidatus Electrothrix sp. AX5]|nr:UDP-N-acetylglucosamine 2-epimerase (non-hydrolyzing) [Candidatus Electrothrix sp. AX5]
MLEKIETILIEEKPDGVLVYGDTNSTLAGALAASKLHVPLIHVEAGLRSYNKSMPEEINRVLTDHISDYLFTPTEIASDNLYKEGITSPVFMVGDVMCDAIKLATRQIQKREKPSDYESYYYASIHRPYNTDNFERLKVILKTLERLDKKVKIALHPRTRQILNTHNYHIHSNNIELLEPLSYLDNIYTMNFASAIITDSGGIQKEAYLLQKQCITVRSETEWVETLQGHWNTLVFDLEEVKNVQQLLHIFPDHTKYHPVVYGNGESARKIANILFEHLVK